MLFPEDLCLSRFGCLAGKSRLVGTAFLTPSSPPSPPLLPVLPCKATPCHKLFVTCKNIQFSAEPQEHVSKSFTTRSPVAQTVLETVLQAILCKAVCRHLPLHQVQPPGWPHLITLMYPLDKPPSPTKPKASSDNGLQQQEDALNALR